MSRRRSTGDYEVGYGKPPKGSRWTKGQSGNPKGRPRRAVNGAAFARVAGQELIIKVDGRNKTVTAIEALYFKFMQRALNGDPTAERHMVKLAAAYGVGAPDRPGSNLPPSIAVQVVWPDARRWEEE